MQAHMTFGKTSIGRSISRTGVFFKKQLWIWPVIAIVLLSVIGWTVSSAIERTIKENLRSELQTLLNVERSMLETWLRVQEANAEALANDQQIRTVALEILAATDPTATEDETTPAVPASLRTKTAALNQRLATELGPA